MFPSLESLPDLPRLVTVAMTQLASGGLRAWLSKGSILWPVFHIIKVNGELSIKLKNHKKIQ